MSNLIKNSAIETKIIAHKHKLTNDFSNKIGRFESEIGV